MAKGDAGIILLRKGSKTLLLLAALLTLCALYGGLRTDEVVTVTADLDADTPKEKLIILDAGHGGEDGGCVGYAGTVEAGLNLEIAELVRQMLEQRGMRVVMTRENENALGLTKNADMAERKRVLNTEGATLCVSIHLNAFTDRAVSGPMAFYMKGSEKGKRLAELVIKCICEAVEHPLRTANPGDYFVIRECESPAVLVECGFISNAEEEKLLNTPQYRQKMADGIVKGLVEFLQEEDMSSNGEILLPENESASIMD